MRYQLAEIDRAEIVSIDEDERLAAEEDVLADAEAHRDALAVAYEVLAGPAEDALGSAAGALAGRPAFDALAARIQALQSEAADVAREAARGRGSRSSSIPITSRPSRRDARS